MPRVLAVALLCIAIARQARAIIPPFELGECPLAGQQVDNDGEDVGPCEHYEGKACCALKKTNTSLVTPDEFHGSECNALSQQCEDIIQLLLCAYCSPEQKDWYKGYGKIYVCKWFADRIYDSCRDDEWQDPYNEGECVNVWAEFDIGTDFLETISRMNKGRTGYFVTSQFDTETKCFNSAPTAASARLLVQLFILAFLALVF